ncbi:SDR family NAD(P)-dependent oxidoreductase [Ferrovibrio sp.]|uniref:SDR family NAD(P)-dependent oxidoreductase n=1 Tax=Ferrovibrio sp. TaxID=1917215 RepID=UPI000CAAC151|nr:glucose 1-dehydrogenase [Ferrovibrio sp.]PJI42517.1 MAG: short-chain dehydrogenase [Ferrovibrio sp.]
MQALTGKIAVITGGNSGIGKATAQLFAQQGAKVAITGRRQDVLDAAVAEIGSGVVGIQGDSADIAQHTRLVREIRQRFGELDIFVANAGVIKLAPSDKVTVEDYDHQFDVNTRGVFFGVQAILPLMRDGGSIILVSSIAATKTLDNHAVYAGSKAAIGAFARAWALELKARKIRVNVLSPGPVETPILDKLGVTAKERPDFVKAMGDMIPLGRMGLPADLASAALFLACDAGSFITGIELTVDGGMSLT